MKGKISIALLFISLIVLLLVIVIIVSYNALIKERNNVEESKAQIEVVCQRRLDLIPNLVETVKGYAEHEKQTLIAVTEARNNAQKILEEIGTKDALNKEDLEKLSLSQANLMQSTKGLIALVENYPELKASSNFLGLQDQLEGTENRIAVARQRYNSSVRSYNTKIMSFPANMTATFLGFKEMDYFESSDDAKKPVKVKFKD